MITVICDLFSRASAGALAINQDAGVQYVTGSDGLRHCAECGEKVETQITSMGKPYTVNCICSCGKRHQEAKRRGIEDEGARTRKRQARLRAFASGEMLRLDFSADDSPESGVSRASRRYAQEFSQKSKWLLFWGAPGTGKTFYAACILNAVLEKGMTGRLATPEQIEAELWNEQDKDGYYRRYAGYDLLVIDDFGADRRSDYIMSIIFKIVDDRYNAGRPTIMTTNYGMREISTASSDDLGRIFSRFWGKGEPVNFKGEDRRRRR